MLFKARAKDHKIRRAALNLAVLTFRYTGHLHALQSHD